MTTTSIRSADTARHADVDADNRQREVDPQWPEMLSVTEAGVTHSPGPRGTELQLTAGGVKAQPGMQSQGVCAGTNTLQHAHGHRDT